jgi:adenylate cyclase
MSDDAANTVEIERKFLVAGDAWKQGATPIPITQGYLARTHASVVRVRTFGDRAFLAVKGKREGLTRAEFEYEIPVEHALSLLALCQGELIEKTRFVTQYEGHTWEIDVFEGANAGLVVAEIELSSEDEPFAHPPWLRDEVSHDRRFANARLSLEPYDAATWGLA